MQIRPQTWYFLIQKYLFGGRHINFLNIAFCLGYYSNQSTWLFFVFPIAPCCHIWFRNVFFNRGTNPKFSSGRWKVYFGFCRNWYVETGILIFRFVLLILRGGWVRGLASVRVRAFMLGGSDL